MAGAAVAARGRWLAHDPGEAHLLGVGLAVAELGNQRLDARGVNTGERSSALPSVAEARSALLVDGGEAVRAPDAERVGQTLGDELLAVGAGGPELPQLGRDMSGHVPARAGADSGHERGETFLPCCVDLGPVLRRRGVATGDGGPGAEQFLAPCLRVVRVGGRHRVGVPVHELGTVRPPCGEQVVRLDCPELRALVPALLLVVAAGGAGGVPPGFGHGRRDVGDGGGPLRDGAGGLLRVGEGAAHSAVERSGEREQGGDLFGRHGRLSFWVSRARPAARLSA